MGAHFEFDSHPSYLFGVSLNLFIYVATWQLLVRARDTSSAWKVVRMYLANVHTLDNDTLKAWDHASCEEIGAAYGMQDQTHGILMIVKSDG